MGDGSQQEAMMASKPSGTDLWTTLLASWLARRPGR